MTFDARKKHIFALSAHVNDHSLFGVCAIMRHLLIHRSIHPPEAKSISVQHFPNNAILVEPLLSSSFTAALRDKFMTQTSLDMVDQNGDLAFEGEILDFKTEPMAIQSDQTAALNRLTITVNVRFFNTFDESKSFETRFSQYMDYPSDQDFNAVKDNLISDIVDMLVEDIFNRAVVNW